MRAWFYIQANGIPVTPVKVYHQLKNDFYGGNNFEWSSTIVITCVWAKPIWSKLLKGKKEVY